MEIVVVVLQMVRRSLRRIGPYLLVEILLPGGTLFALLVFLYRHGRLRVGDPAMAGIATVPAAVSVIGHASSRRAGISNPTF